jgi:hypothetical protein
MRASHTRVNFTNILPAAFGCADPKSAKRLSSHQCLFALLGSAHAKAARKTLVKLTPGSVLQNFVKTMGKAKTKHPLCVLQMKEKTKVKNKRAGIFKSHKKVETKENGFSVFYSFATNFCFLFVCMCCHKSIV